MVLNYLNDICVATSDEHMLPQLRTFFLLPPEELAEEENGHAQSDQTFFFFQLGAFLHSHFIC